jgi:hypothetical protein
LNVASVVASNAGTRINCACHKRLC